MQLEAHYLDFLQNMEFVVVKVYQANPGLTDPDVIKAYDRLIKFYERKKKHLPEMDLMPAGNAGLVYDAVFTIIEWRRMKSPGESVEIEGMEGIRGGDVPLPVVIRCLEKLHKSAGNWHKRNGIRGYLDTIVQFIV